MNEPQAFGTSSQSSIIAARANRVDIENRGDENTKSGLDSLGIYRANPSPEVMRSFETTTGCLALLRFSRHSSPKIEFLTSSHLIAFSTDGISKGFEWSDGHQTRALMPLERHIVLFNPAQHYLRIQANQLKSDCHMLVLAIQPSATRWRDNLEIDIESVQFQQRIGLRDDAACQTLIAIMDELESPGLNRIFYFDALISLLLARLMRCASNFAEPKEKTYVKGGLPNWRLKRAIAILEGDSGKTPSLSEVAESVRLSPTAFCRAFKQSTGTSPHRYSVVHRIERAKALMNDHKLNLTQIAFECGFSSSSQFSVVFKRFTGVSPRQFRRAL